MLRRPPLLPTPRLPSRYVSARPLGGYEGGFVDPPERPSPQENFVSSRSKPAPAQPGLAIPSEFFEITRAHFRVIKCLHHIHHIQDGIPASFRKTVGMLTKQLRPAFSDEDFHAVANSLAMTWATNSTVAMRHHYETVLDDSEKILRSSALPEPLLDRSIDFASKWARNQLRRKLRDDTLDAAISRIRDLQALSFEHSASLACSEDRSRTTATQTTLQTVAAPPHSCSTAAVRLANMDINTQPLDELQNPTTSANRPLAFSLEASAVSDRLEPSRHNLDLNVETCLSSAATGPPAPASDAPTSSEHSSEMTLDSLQPAASSRSTSQLDLFGSVVERPASQATQLPADLEWKPNVVLGDSNLQDFCHPDTTVISRTKGRLSHLRSLFTSTVLQNMNVLHVIICLSTLDKRNLLSTNVSSLKSLLGNLRKVFPGAKVSIMSIGIDDRFTDEEKHSCSSFNTFICSRTPSSSFYIPTAIPFACNNDVWELNTQAKVFDILKEYLN